MKKTTLLEDIFKDKKNITEGIYFSYRTGKIFEARKKWGKVRITYVDDRSHGPTISPTVFAIQYDVFEFYELLIPYED